MVLRAGLKDWEEVSNFCHCREFRTDSHHVNGLINTLTLTELIRLLIIRVGVKENTTSAARYRIFSNLIRNRI